MKWIVGFLAVLALSMPLGLAQTTADTNVKTVSATDLKLKQIGQGFGDFFFGIRAMLTFDESAKVDLMKERNDYLKIRQQEWLEMKSRAFAQFESHNMTEEQKKEITDTIQSEHKSIIEAHLKLTEEITKIEVNAKARGDAALETKANAAELETSKSGLSLGLGMTTSVNLAAITGPIDTNIGAASDTQMQTETDLAAGSGIGISV